METLQNLVEIEYYFEKVGLPQKDKRITREDQDQVQFKVQIQDGDKCNTPAGQCDSVVELDPTFEFLNENLEFQNKVRNKLLGLQRMQGQRVSIKLTLPWVSLVQKFVIVPYKTNESGADKPKFFIIVEKVEKLDLSSDADSLAFTAMVTKEGAPLEEAKVNKLDYAAQDITHECFGISHTFRMQLLIQTDQESNPQQVVDQALQDLELIKVYCNPCFKMQSSANLLPLLNICNFFHRRPHEMRYDLLELEIMCAQSLIAGRKFIQAIERLRKIQGDIIQKKIVLHKCDAQTLCIQLEILCADSMNQHQLIGEKLESYQRIVKLSQDFENCKAILQNNGFPRSQRQTTESHIVDCLIQLNPVLIQILKCCLLSNLEAVKTASLKHIEYIFDNIGCSLGDKQIINTIQALITTYPKQSGCTYVYKPHVYQIINGELLIVESFTCMMRQTICPSLNVLYLQSYEQIYVLPQNETEDVFGNSFMSRANAQAGEVNKIKQYAAQISTWKFYKDYFTQAPKNKTLTQESSSQTSTLRSKKEVMRICQSSMHHQTQIVNIRIHYNHILDSILQLFNSTSQYLLKQIFEQILQKSIFVGQYDTIFCLMHEQLTNELRIFLVKFADKIASVCQGDLKLSAQFLTNTIKTMMPTLLVTKEQIELENKQIQVINSQQNLHEAFLFGMSPKKKLDMHQLLKSPSLIVNDSIQMACEKLWMTIKLKVIHQYSLTSEQVSNVCSWIGMNLKFLSQVVQGSNGHWSMLTNGQQKFLTLNIELLNELCQLQISHIQLLVPKLTEQEKHIRRLSRRNEERKQQPMTKQLRGDHQRYMATPNIAQGNIQNQIMHSNVASYPHGRLVDPDLGVYQIPDNITDLDHQNKLVDDSINDEFDYNPVEVSHSFHSHYVDQDLMIGNERLTHIYNRQKRLDNSDSIMQHVSTLNENNMRLIKLPSVHIIQQGIFLMIEPLIFWVEYSIRTRDKLPLFKQLWQVLKSITQQCCLPHQKLKVDLISIVFPHLQKVKDVCMNNTPSLDMLHFLQLVLAEIKPKAVHGNAHLREFLLSFLIVFAKCIPHYIHDEIFKVCEIVIDLTAKYLKPIHIQQIVESLVDKYTMKSKAYKQILKMFLEKIITHSQSQLDKMLSQNKLQHFINSQIQAIREEPVEEEKKVERYDIRQFFDDITKVQISQTIHQPALSTQNRRKMISNEQTTRAQQPLDITSLDDIDNYVYEDQESGSHILDDDLEDNQITHLRQTNHTLRQRMDRRIIDRNQNILTNSRSQQVIGIQQIDSRNSQQVQVQGNQRHQIPNQEQQRAHLNQGLQQILTPMSQATQQFAAEYEAKMESIITPFDTVLRICLFDNQAPSYSKKNNLEDCENLQEIHLEKLELAAALIKALTCNNVKLFERFLKQLDSQNVLLTMYSENEQSQHKVIVFLLEMASYCKENFQCMEIKKYIVQQHYYQGLENAEDAEAGVYFQEVKHIVQDTVQILSHPQLILIKLFASFISQMKQIHSNPQRQQHTLNLMMVLWTYLLSLPTLANQMVLKKINDPAYQVYLVESVNLREDHLKRLVEQYLTQLVQHNLVQFLSEDEDKNGLDDLRQNYDQVNFSTMTIGQKKFESSQTPQNFMETNAECTNSKYLNSLVTYGFENFEYLEKILLQTCGLSQKPEEDEQISNSFFGSAQRLKSQSTAGETSNPWVSQKFLSTKILIKIIQLTNFESKTELDLQIGALTMKLVQKLLKKEVLVEDKACALNLIAAYCGFTRQVSLLDEHIKFTSPYPIAKELYSPRHMIQQIFAANGQKVAIQIWHELFNIVEGDSRNYVSHEQTLKEAASILIQMAAPRDSVFHFLKLAYEKNQVVMQNLYSQLNVLNCFHKFGTQPESTTLFEDQSSVYSSDESDLNSVNSSEQDLPQTDKQQHISFANNRVNIRTQVNDMTQSRGFQKYVSTYFFADNYTDLQLFAMIHFFEDENQIVFQFKQDALLAEHSGHVYKHQQSVFLHTHKTLQVQGSQEITDKVDSLMQTSVQSNGEGNELKLQALWVDRSKKQSLFQEQQPSERHQDGHSPLNLRDSHSPLSQKYSNSLNETPIFDGFEDQIIQGLNPQSLKANTMQRGKHSTDELDHETDKSQSKKKITDKEITDMQLKEDKLLNFDHFNNENRDLRNDQSPSDDLGIIDLDNDEDDEDDLFDVDDDKLPILKNIFSKKNRPNNGKSVAIGNRSQGGTMKIRPQIDTIKAQMRQNLAYQQKSQYQKQQQQNNEKQTLQQKPNSAQMILKSSNRRKAQANQNRKQQQVMRCKQKVSSPILRRNHFKCTNETEEENREPVVIYDEDNLIIDEFLTGKRPQSGRRQSISEIRVYSLTDTIAPNRQSKSSKTFKRQS